METYIVKITMSSDDEPWSFLVHSDETKEYVTLLISETQKEFHFDNPCDMMDYVCDTYDFKWEYIPPEINIEL